MKNNVGIYKITCRANGKIYIGSSIRLKERIKNHAYMLNLGTHRNGRLQNAWKKYGCSAFDFDVILNCCAESTLHYEKQFMTEFSSVSDGFNISSEPSAPMQGVKHSKEAIEKIRASKVAMIRTPEMRAKMSATLTGRSLSEKHKASISASLKGYTHTEETRQKMRDACQGRTDEHKRNLSASLTGRAKSDEHRRKTGEATKRRCQDPAYLARMSAAQKKSQTTESLAIQADRNRARMLDPAIRAKISATLTGRKASPETRAKLSEMRKGKKISDSQKALLSTLAKERWARKRKAQIA